MAGAAVAGAGAGRGRRDWTERLVSSLADIAAVHETNADSGAGLLISDPRANRPVVHSAHLIGT